MVGETPTSLSLPNMPLQFHGVEKHPPTWWRLSEEAVKNGSRTTDYLLKLKADGLDSEAYNLAKHQW